MRYIVFVLALLLASPVVAQSPSATPRNKSIYIQRREAIRAAQERAAAEKKQQTAADRARMVAFNKFLVTGVLPADPAEAQNILRLYDLRLRQAALAKAQSPQPNGRWVVGTDPATGRQFNYFLAEEQRRDARADADRAFGSMQRSRAFTGSVTPDGIGGLNVDLQSTPQ